MDPVKRTIIVKEIEHWRRSKLLPDHYCQFLLNLYNEADSQGASVQEERRQAIVESHPLQWLTLISIIGLICYIALHFNGFPLVLQIGTVLFLIIAAFAASVYYRERRPLLSSVLFGAGALMLLAAGAYALRLNGGGWGQSTLFIAGCAVIWIVFGAAFRVQWIHFCGWVGLLLAYTAAVHHLLRPESWIALQMAWLPLALLFGWIGWLVSARAKREGALFLILACLLWFVPEAYAFGWTAQAVTVIQTLMLGKLILLGAAAYILRKTWTEWVV